MSAPVGAKPFLYSGYVVKLSESYCQKINKKANKAINHSKCEDIHKKYRSLNMECVDYNECFLFQVEEI